MPIESIRSHAIALAIGLLLGLERERRATGPHKPSGSRTFTVVALTGSICARLGEVAVGAGVVATAALAAAGYVRSRDEDVGLTTEFALVAAFVLGALALHEASLSAALAVVVAVLLASKSQLHRFSAAVSEDEVDDALKFLVLAFVVLPILPDTARGPYGVFDAERIWLLVVLISAMRWLGYIAMRGFGSSRGVLVEGFAGSFVSGVAATLTLARRYRQRPASSVVAAALLASVGTLFIYASVVGAAARELARPAVAVASAGIVPLAAIAWALARRVDYGDRAPDSRAFALRPALETAVALTVMLLLTRWSVDAFGGRGVIGAAFLGGFAESHASAVAAAQLVHAGTLDARTGFLAGAAALASNTITKAVVAAIGGGRAFALRFVLAIAVPVLAIAVAVVVVAPGA